MSPRIKRQKTAGPRPVLPELTAWLEGAGVWFDTDAMTFEEQCSDVGTYLSITAKRDLEAGHHLCTIPKDACLSVRNAACADILKEEGLISGLGLVMAVMHERLLGDKSRWYGYFKTLPAREYVPIFWTKEELKALEATELDRDMAEELEFIATDYEEQIEPLIAKHGLQEMGYSFEHFKAAASLVASRAFKVDELLGDAMVPLADVFNHKASVVALSEEYAVFDADASSSSDSEEEGDEQEDDDCSNDDDEVQHQGDDDGSEDEGIGSEGSVEILGSDADVSGCDVEAADAPEGQGMVLPRARDEAQIRGGAFLAQEEPELHGMRRANGLGLALEICIVDDEDAGALRIVTASALLRGAEIHNTYGELGNRDLVEKYGFALAENPHNSVALEMEPVWDWANRALGECELQRRRELLEETLPYLARRKRYSIVHACPGGHLPAWAAVVATVLAAAPPQEGEPPLSWDGLLPADSPAGAALQLATTSKRHNAVCCTRGGIAESGGSRLGGVLEALVTPRLEQLERAARSNANASCEAAGYASRDEKFIAARAAASLRESEIALLRDFVSPTRS